MFSAKAVFSGFSVNNLEEAEKFYTQVLGLKVEKKMGLQLILPNGGSVFVYQKDNHEPAAYTVLNFVVDDINLSVEELTQKKVVFEKYEGFNQDEKGIARGISANMGPDIAWFKDPAGNIFSVLQEKIVKP